MIPLVRSLAAILEMIARSQHADVAWVYEYSAEHQALLPWSGVPGRSAAQEIALRTDHARRIGNLQKTFFMSASDAEAKIFADLLQAYHACVLLPLSLKRPRKLFLYVVWKQPTGKPDLDHLNALAESLDVLLTRTEQEASIESLLKEAASLQLELADWKIAERTTGLLTDGATGADALQIVREHISRVLQSCETAAEIEQRVASIREELASRHDISAAKTILQRNHGMTEQQAYLHLQRSSRRARRPLAEIAGEVVAEQVRNAGRRIA